MKLTLHYRGEVIHIEKPDATTQKEVLKAVLTALRTAGHSKTKK